MRKIFKLCAYLVAGLMYVTVAISCAKPTDPVKDDIPTGFARIKGKISLPAGISASAAGAEVYILGQRQFKVNADTNGNYEILVDVRKNSIASKGIAVSRAGIGDLSDLGFQLIGLSQDETYGTKADDIEVAEGSDELLPPITIEKTGSISGKVILEGAADPTGTDVYIPGTSSMAKADAAGNFIISKVPTGTYIYLRAEKTGYAPKYWTNVIVQPDKTVTLPQVTLPISTGVAGTISISGGATISRSKEVEVTVSYSADAFLMQVSEDPSFIGANWSFVQDKITYTFSSDGFKTLYVKFSDSNGLETSVSDSITIVEKPMPLNLSPNSSTGEVRPFFRWDPSMLDAQSYDFQISSDPGFSTLIEEYKALPTNSIHISSVLSNNSTYYWRVRAVDIDGISGDWVTDDFKIDISIPRPISPAYDVVTDRSKPIFTWECAATGVKFLFQIAETSDFSTVIETGNKIEGTSYITKNPLKSDITYFWRVAVEGEGTVHGDWSTVFVFRVMIPPVITMQFASTENMTTRRPLFTWNSAERFNSYRIQISTSEDFSSIAVDASTLATNSYRPAEPGLKSGTNYFWRVAYNDTNNALSAWSEIKEFSIAKYELSEFKPTGAVQESLPKYGWKASFNPSETYKFQISSRDDFSVLLEDIKDVKVNSYTGIYRLDNKKKYYWRVKAVSVDGDEGPWSTAQEIMLDYSGMIQNEPLSEARLLTRNPAFSWDQNLNANLYAIQVDDDPLFISPEINKEEIATTVFESNGNLKAGKSYYWRVCYFDINGARGPWSEKRKFIIAPYDITINNPLGNPGTSQPLFSWSDSYIDNETYTIQISMDDQFKDVFLEKSGITKNSYRITESIENRKTYYWRVKAIASDGDVGPWSGYGNIYLEYWNTSLNAPWNGETLYNASPTFTWNTISWAKKYRIVASKDNKFSTLVLDMKVDCSEAKTDVILPDNCTLFWKVTGIDEFGISGDWSETRSIYLPAHTLNMWISIKLPLASTVARFSGGGTYYTQPDASLAVSIENSYDFTSFEWSIDGVPIKDDTGKRITGPNCSISKLSKGNYTLSLIAMRNGIPYDTQAIVIVQ